MPNKFGRQREKNEGSASIIVLAAVLAFAVVAVILIYGRRRPIFSPAPAITTTTSSDSSGGMSATGATGLVAISENSSSASAAQLSPDWSAQLAEQNRSSLHLVSGGNMLIITDPLGRQTGYSTTTKEVLQQIPDSNFSSQSITNIESEDAGFAADYFIDINRPIPGTYEVVVIGSPSADTFDLTMVTFSTDGERQNAQELQGLIGVGSNRVFQINFTSAPQVSSTITSLQ